jgi:hypothetical protein
LKVF